MTAVIRYQIPYIINSTSPLIIYFSLGNDVALHSILGIPCFLMVGAIIDLVKGQLVCSELNQVFMLHLDPPGKGLTDGTTYDTYFVTVPDGFFSNVLPLSSLLQ